MHYLRTATGCVTDNPLFISTLYRRECQCVRKILEKSATVCCFKLACMPWKLFGCCLVLLQNLTQALSVMVSLPEVILSASGARCGKVGTLCIKVTVQWHICSDGSHFHSGSVLGWPHVTFNDSCHFSSRHRGWPLFRKRRRCKCLDLILSQFRLIESHSTAIPPH